MLSFLGGTILIVQFKIYFLVVFNSKAEIDLMLLVPSLKRVSIKRQCWPLFWVVHQSKKELVFRV